MTIWSRLIIAITLIAASGTASTAAGAVMKIAARPSPRIVSIRDQGAISSQGGNYAVRAKIENASTCQLTLKNHPLISVSFTRWAVNCAGGAFSKSIHFSANTLSLYVPVKFELSARNGRLVANRTFQIEVDKVSVATTPTIVPATTAPPTTTVTTVPISTPTTTATTLPPPTTVPVPQFATSTNWAGYIVPNSSLNTSVHGEWTIPTLNCQQTPNANSATWVGIGGAGSGTGYLLQTGITDDCVNGLQQDQGFWELYPINAEQPFSSFTVRTGDVITASIGYTGSSWVTLVQDLNTGIEGYSVVGNGWGTAITSSDTILTEQGTDPFLIYLGGRTAEWIVENYVQFGGMPPLVDFGSINFSSMTTNITGWSLSTSEGEEMVQNGAVVALPSDPSTNEYSITWQ